jgi:hypothetical protein
METNLRFSALPVVPLSHLSGFLPSAVFGDVLFNFGSINKSSQSGRCTGPYCRRPGISNIQNVYKLIPSAINPENLALPLWAPALHLFLDHRGCYPLLTARLVPQGHENSAE